MYLLEGFLIIIGVFSAVLYYLPTKIVYNLTPYYQWKHYSKVKRNIRNLVKGNWKITSFSPFDVHRELNFLTIYVKVRNTKNAEWTNDVIIFDETGKIIKQRLVSNMMRKDRWEGV